MTQFSETPVLFFFTGGLGFWVPCPCQPVAVPRLGDDLWAAAGTLVWPRAAWQEGSTGWRACPSPTPSCPVPGLVNCFTSPSFSRGQGAPAASQALLGPTSLLSSVASPLLGLLCPCSPGPCGAQRVGTAVLERGHCALWAAEEVLRGPVAGSHAGIDVFLDLS